MRVHKQSTGTNPRRRRYIAPLIAAALGLAGAGSAVPAHADTGLGTAGTTTTAPLSAEASASLQARTSGKGVLVEADTTATDQVTANSNGSFTLDRTELPTRAKKNNTWVPVDATLQKNSEGTISPAAVNTTVDFSAGGSAPLAAFDDGKGHTFSLSWPTALPAPTLSGPSATYTDVFPGTDLTVTATTQGGFSEVLTVHTAAAAANPALADLKLATHATGLTLSTGADGALTATDAKTGAVVFSSAPASMWDSTVGAVSATTRPSTPATSGLIPTPGARTPSRSTSAQPGAGAHRDPINVKVGNGMLDLTPDPAALTGRGEQFPIYLDPAISPGAQDWDYVSQAYPTQSYWNGAGSQKEDINGTQEYVARVGYNDADSSSNMWAWSYFGLGSFSSLSGLDITNATLQLTQVAASQPSVAYTMYAAASGAISSSTDYNNAPGTSMAAHSVSVSGNGQYNIDVTGDVSTFTSGGGGTLTYKVYETSTDPNSYRWLADNPTIAVTYYHTPAVPTNLTITTGGLTVPCSTNSSAPTLIAKSSGGSVALNFTTTDPDTGIQINANEYLSTNGAAAVHTTTPPVTDQAGNNILTENNVALTDGDTYTWYASAAATNVIASAHSASCYFRADETSPVVSAVTSTAFPQQGGDDTAGQAGSFTFTATDSGTNPAGVTKFLYNLGGSFTGTSSVTATSSTATATATPPNWGANTLWVAAVDAAGNQSVPFSYAFFVPTAAYTPGVTGDITGDGKPDLLAVDNAGNLRVYSNPQPANVAVSTADVSDDPLQAGGSILITGKNNPLWPSATFAGSLVAHGGSFSGKNVDDLMILHNGTFYVEQNPGSGTGWAAPQIVAKPTTCTVPSGYTFSTCAAADYSSDWSAVRQIIDVPPTTASGRPGLITVEEVGGIWSLYYYAPTASGIGFASATLLSTSTSAWNWGSVTLVYAGDVTSDGVPDLMVRENSGTIGFFGTIEAGINQDPNTAQAAVANTGGVYPPINYPYLASDEADYNSDPTLWAVSGNGTLSAIPVTPGATPAFGTAVTISPSGWGARLQAFENSTAPYNNSAISADGATYSAVNSMDGYGSTYSATALDTGFTPGNALTPLGSGPIGSGIYDQDFNSVNGLSADAIIVTDDGFEFTWPGNDPDNPNNYQAVGQTIPAPIDQTPDAPQDNLLSFIGSSSGRTEGLTGSAILTWSDGTTQTVTLAFDDWTLGGGTMTAVDPVIGSTTYRDTDSGQNQTMNVYLFQDTIALSPPNDGAQLAAITLPSFPTSEAMHIFATAARTVTPPTQAPAVISRATTSFTAGNPGTYTVLTTGSPAPAITETGTLPTGLTFTAGTGTATISGTATTAGTYPVTITATSSAGTATLALLITVTSSGPAPTHEWVLNNGTGSTATDTAGADNLTLLGGYSWVTGTTHGTVASFDGTSGAGASAANAISTTASYTVSAWANLSTLPSGNATVVSEWGTNNSPFYLQYNSGSWAFSISNNDTTSPTLNGAVGPSTVVAGTWYHITGVYNATTDTATLYVNGQLVGSQSNLPSWSAPGTLNIGRDLYTGLQVDYFPGQISNVETWNSALSATQVAALS